MIDKTKHRVLTSAYYETRLQDIEGELSLFANAIATRPTQSHATSWASLARYKQWLKAKLAKKLAEEELALETNKASP